MCADDEIVAGVARGGGELFNSGQNGRIYRIDGNGWIAGWRVHFGGTLGDGGAIAGARGEAGAVRVVQFLDHECGGLTLRDFVGEYAAVDDQSSGHARREKSDS